MSSQKLKLLHFHAPLHFGGGEVFLENFYNASSNLFENETILFSKSEIFIQKLKDSHIKYSEFYNKNLGSGSMKKYIKVLVFSILHLRKFKKIFNLYKDADFVVGHGFPFVVFIPLLKMFALLPREVRVIYFQHGRLGRPSKGFFWKYVYFFLLNKFDHILVNTSLVRDDICTPIPKLYNKIIIFPTGFDFKRNISISSQEAEIPIPKNKTIAVYAARPSPQKNHQIFFELFKKLEEKNITSNFLLVLPGIEKKSDFAERIVSMGFEENVIFPGAVDHEEVLRITNKSDICLFPSLEEGFGIGILEPISMSVPCVVFKKTIAQEFSDFVIVAVDKDDFLRKSVELIENKILRKTEQQRLSGALPEIEERFDLLHNIQKLDMRLKNI